jgi:numb-like protein
MCIRMGRCTFSVKYLGSVEVQESRGMEVCESALKLLKKGKKKALKATLHVSGDGPRVVEKVGKNKAPPP